MRNLPNIIVTGTPGVGKSTHCEMLCESTGLKHLSINQVVKDRDCHDGWDEAFNCWIVDEDKLLDSLEDELEQGGYVIDWHACDLFPESLIDLVVVLRVESHVLWDRLTARHYSEAKLQENLDSEIMEVLLEEAREAFAEEVVIELRSDTLEEMESNVERIEKWLQEWNRIHGEEEDD